MISAMGRKLLVAENPSVHQILSSSLLVASMVVVVSLVSSLCIFWRKTETPHDDSQDKTTENLEVITPSSPPPNSVGTPPPETITEPPSAAVVVELESEGDKKGDADAAQPQPDQEEQQPPLPPPPGVPHLRGAGAASCQIRTSTSSSSKLLSSMSVRLQGGAKGLRQQYSRREEMQDKIRDRIKLKQEDSVWKKKIILGEKCRVPDEEDDTFVYDNKGNRISTYHPRTLSALPGFGETSSIDPCSIPSSGEQK